MTRDQSLYRNVTSHLYFIKLYFIKSTIVTLLLVKRLNPMFLHTQCLLVPINADRCRRFATFEQLSVGVLLGSWCIARRPVPRQCGLGKGWAHIKNLGITVYHLGQSLVVEKSRSDFPRLGIVLWIIPRMLWDTWLNYRLQSLENDRSSGFCAVCFFSFNIM